MAAELGISASYLNLVERNQRPVTAQLLRCLDQVVVTLAAFSAAEHLVVSAEGRSGSAPRMPS